MRFVVTVFLICFVYSSWAKPIEPVEGTEVGNGGFTVVCPAKNAPSVQFYDVFNMSEDFGLSLPQITPVSTEEAFWAASELASKVLQNYSKLDPYSAERLKKELDNFWKKSAVKSEGQVFVVVNPPQVKKVPEDCELRQMISFLKLEYPPYSQQYVVDMDLFLKLPVREMAAALLHEILYNETFYKKDWSSAYRNVVKFNSFLLSIPNQMIATHEQFLLWQSKNIKMRFDNNFLQSYYASYPIRCFRNSQSKDRCSVDFYPSGKLRTAFLIPSVYKTQQADNMIFIEEFATFSESGRLMTANILNDYVIDIGGEKRVCTTNLVFDEKGKIIDCI